MKNLLAVLIMILIGCSSTDGAMPTDAPSVGGAEQTTLATLVETGGQGVTVSSTGGASMVLVETGGQSSAPPIETGGRAPTGGSSAVSTGGSSPHATGGSAPATTGGESTTGGQSSAPKTVSPATVGAPCWPSGNCAQQWSQDCSTGAHSSKLDCVSGVCQYPAGNVSEDTLCPGR
jgi:hypothetical protein